ncbi:Gfo/Idh/MocA family oxidoreductase [Klebsiella pneumoniae]|nr:Gfo/Idh/MocA family oxidoreductase [Klebsiella pneumoniae]MDW5801379.1 Gfo/Idh/MocA family oxidoreductase [Klebsiella pneumoniae]MDW5837840.1 Gfo/Idh/MocA family oxidoreductase [Klebsiella pneumoniae]MDW5884519.1 Gfo/Idh/MocA family oxidoreductase [Klebsiella pneumoniae]MDW5987479.1 Gfo/Idh/MocA family oxidoreductase [Klebsiella pneumoniae]
MKKEADMIHPIANAPCSWGVDDPKNPNLPAWATVLKEAAQAGYRSIELGPWGYLPTDPASLRAALEDNAHVLMEYDNGAIGSLWSSAVNCGSMHGQKVRIIGEKASLEWWDEQPNQLRYEIQGEPVRILERGMDYLDPLARQDDRIGGGHPEGLFEAWSNLYRRFAIAMDAADRRDEALLADFWYPDARAGAFGVRWVENCVRSADNGACWVDFR